MMSNSEARKRQATNEPDEGMEALRNSLRWHFACHAEEPQKSYASLGIQNAETIAARMVAAAEARGAQAVLDAVEALPSWRNKDYFVAAAREAARNAGAS